MSCCYVALGGNLGDVADCFSRALDRLDATPRVTVGSVSSVYATPAVGKCAGGDFLNAACELETALGPAELLALLKEVESEFGRQHQATWGPRPLDLDLVFYGEMVIDQPGLCVPHPACWYRRFVLDPLAEIAAAVVHPQKGLTVNQLRERLLVRPFRLALAGGDPEFRRDVRRQISQAFPQVELSDWHDTAGATTSEPTIIAWLGVQDGGIPGDVEFTSLPLVPRLDVSARNEGPLAFLRHVLESVLMEPRRHNRPLRNTP